MNAIEAIRSVRYDLLEYIQEKVIVDFDNNRKLPVGFTHKRKRHSTREILGCFRTQPNCHINAFLVRTEDEEVYFLYFCFLNSNSKGRLNAGCWVLSFRVLNDRELRRDSQQALINELLNAALPVEDIRNDWCRWTLFKVLCWRFKRYYKQLRL